MIRDNRASKYILYAIGEIILVVIGILIALQINDWNENRKNRKLEQEMMANINSEFRSNLAQLEESIEAYRNTEQAIRILMSKMKTSEVELMKNNIDSLLSVSVDVYKYQPTQNILTEIISTGNLNLITNDSLKYLLVEWSSEFNEIEESWQTLDDFNQNMVFPYLTKNLSLRNIDKYSLLQWKEKSKFNIDYERVFNDLEFENQLDNLGWAVVNYRLVLGRLKLLIEKLIRLTDD